MWSPIGRGIGGKGLIKKIASKTLARKIVLRLGIQSSHSNLILVPFGTKSDREAIRRAMLRITGVTSAFVTDGTGGTEFGELHVIVKAKSGNTQTEDQFLMSVNVIEVRVREVLAGIARSKQKEQKRREVAAQKEFDDARRLIEEAALAVNS